jgi:hypothetical protein
MIIQKNWIMQSQLICMNDKTETLTYVQLTIPKMDNEHTNYENIKKQQQQKRLYHSAACPNVSLT